MTQFLSNIYHKQTNLLTEKNKIVVVYTTHYFDMKIEPHERTDVVISPFTHGDDQICTIFGSSMAIMRLLLNNATNKDLL